MDTSRNQSAFFQTKYQRAVAAYDQDDSVRADDLCRELTGDFVCPRFIQAHALQLQSLCTRHHWRARSFLVRCLEVLAETPSLYEDVDAHDENLIALAEHTQLMLDELDSLWEKQWKARGLPVPEEPGTESKDESKGPEASGDKSKELEEGVGGLAIGASPEPSTLERTSSEETVRQAVGPSSPMQASSSPVRGSESGKTTPPSSQDELPDAPADWNLDDDAMETDDEL
ncbi:uncharacterized protein LTR77_007409 [Saxophila tyrrhenica]|uniref:Uncharacterized protein n=1 Tax=Saxophila tyrrhenica TaxID=1690608 RepID=A0AAV9P8P5_9PEZI|nr:hypothetical protein LTR77_007409 [Saxophila tyrrhenica]